jgi:hypothetical protein
MGRPLSKQQLFGANSNNNIKVQFHNGTESVKGYIVEQTGSKRFKCTDENGVTAVCYMVDKASADLAAGEMSISFIYDDGTVQQATKIARHRATFNYDGSVQSMPWNFSTSTSDGAWQIEEAGTDTAMASATDLEEDDVPAGLFDKPVPGSGSYLATIEPDTSSAGTPYAPGAGVASVTNATLGLWRKKYLGNFGGSPGDGCDVTFVRNTQGFFGKPDTYVSFGMQNDATEEYYTFEWVGYFKAPSSGNFNFYINSDDDVYFWIGTNALGTANTELNAHMGVSGGNEDKNTNSVTLVANQYYPVRIQFGEYSGAENCQLFYAKVGDSDAVAGNDGLSGTQVWYHNGTTKGH